MLDQDPTGCPRLPNACGQPPTFSEAAAGRILLRLERALATAAHQPRETMPVVLDLLVESLGARFGVFFRKKKDQPRSLVGRWADATAIGRPDKLVDCRHLRRVLRSSTPTWVSESSTRKSRGWRAGFRLDLEGQGLAAVVMEWTDFRPPGIEASQICPFVSLALALDELRDENRRLSEEIEVISERPVSLPGPFPSFMRGLLDRPRNGEHRDETIAKLRTHFPDLLGDSPPILAVLRAALTASRSDIPVLVEGESGTGKELVARAIHRASQRHDQPFVCENCGAVPENLVESEFFGHETGAFTGATEAKPGLFERAHGGTVFLDEIGEMDLSMQKKLLRVLQEKEVRRIGARETVDVDFRVVSATNRVLEDLIANGSFREDLYYRLNVTTISMPALRERPTDIPILVKHFNERYAKEIGREPLEITDWALSMLSTYQWPGNVRELRNEIWRLVSSGARRADSESMSRRILRSPRNMKGLPGRQARLIPLAQTEREVLGATILEAIRRARGNRTEAARRLGITRATLYRRLRRYRLLRARTPEE